MVFNGSTTDCQSDGMSSNLIVRSKVYVSGSSPERRSKNEEGPVGGNTYPAFFFTVRNLLYYVHR